MNRLSFAAQTLVYSLAISTTILHIVNLKVVVPQVKTLPTPCNGLSSSSREFPWDHTQQVALDYTNDVFHIQSESDWETLGRFKTFKLGAESNHTYTISMHQQLHCLNAVRMAYLSYYTAGPRLSATIYEDADMCIEQMRQHIMCNGDLTLEQTKLYPEKDGTMVPGSAGTYNTHRCKDWKALETEVNRCDI